jgi:hypothetical protein
VVRVLYRELLEFDIADDSSKALFFLFGVRKSGSSILNSMVNVIAEANGVSYVDVAGTFFRNGHPVSTWQRDPELQVLLRPGNLYAGFRNCPMGLAGDPRFIAGRKVLMVRDPRDALVSEYYSNAYSHSVPQSGKARQEMLAHREQALQSAIDAYVLKRAPAFRQTLREYASLPPGENLKILRYEDFITRKRALIGELCSHFAWSISDRLVDQILGWADVIPAAERPTEFVRKVLPGDHRDKLRPATIEQLNGILHAEMELYGYR